MQATPRPTSSGFRPTLASFEKELRTPLDAATGVRKKLLENFTKFSKASKKEPSENKVTREVELAATKVKLVEATAIHGIAIQACYDLFCQLLADDPHDQWDRIVRFVGHKNNGLRMKTFESLEDCIAFHKRTVFTLDAAERQKSYMMGSLKKPHKMTIKGHVSHWETMNGYISLLPMLRDSSLVVASTVRGKRTIQRCHIGWNRIGHLSH